ncbi:MAG: EamA family transporter [Hyphomicrobiales bacterium]|nr:EamA family transporter [Hyphomicrobiales bacterium]
MGDLIIQWSGTPAGEALALVLALFSAMAHAIFGAINKGGVDPYFNRGSINISYSLMAAPFALFVFPWPDFELFKILCVTYFVHMLYEWLQTVSFAKGAFTVVYPIARGTGPFITALCAVVIFGEHLKLLQWVGLGMLSGSIFLLAFVNYRIALSNNQNISGLREAVIAAFFTGIMIATYTTIDAYGIRLAADPFTFLCWFFMMGGFGFPLIAAHRWLKTSEHPPIPDLAMRGIFGAIVGVISFGAIMLASRLGKVAEAATLRETSIIFATGIGVLIFKERIKLPALILIGLIALGAILVKIG